MKDVFPVPKGENPFKGGSLSGSRINLPSQVSFAMEKVKSKTNSYYQVQPTKELLTQHNLKGSLCQGRFHKPSGKSYPTFLKRQVKFLISEEAPAGFSEEKNLVSPFGLLHYTLTETFGSPPVESKSAFLDTTGGFP